ncbi:MAG: glycerate kinase [Chitinophagaceae bacterium]|nr:glycerate kinase [Chitinophagaceae bacterium]
MHILIAPNAFKNSLDAVKVAKAIEEGFQQSRLSCTTHCFPVGDGGDGTGELIVQHCNGKVTNAEVHDPLHRTMIASFGLIEKDSTAVIEMADASGLRLLQTHELNPLRASSYGTGELMRHALDKGISRIILCIGGSATVDGATGILSALGFCFLDKDGKELQDMPESLAKLDRIESSGVDKRMMHTELIVLCDVANPLLGEEGAAAIFGPQKGASPDKVKKLETSLSVLRDVVFKQTGRDMAIIKHGGAAGGTAAGLWAVLNARLVNGIDHFLSLTGFDQALEKADLVVTAEGSIDIQTLQGKGPFGVAQRAKQKGIPVIGLAGKIPGTIPAELKKYFDELICINKQPVSLDAAIKNTRLNLISTARELGDKLAENNRFFTGAQRCDE